MELLIVLNKLYIINMATEMISYFLPLRLHNTYKQIEYFQELFGLCIKWHFHKTYRYICVRVCVLLIIPFAEYTQIVFFLAKEI